MFAEYRDILQFKPNDDDRSPQDRLKLSKLISHVKFFLQQNVQEELFYKECQRYLKLEKYEPGEYIYMQGEKSDRMFIVLEGCVEIKKQSKNSYDFRVQERNLEIIGYAQKVEYFWWSNSESPTLKRSRLRVPEEDLDNELIKICISGEYFGESALLGSSSRQEIAAVYSNSDQPCYCATLDYISYELVFVNTTKELDKKMKAIEKIFPHVPSNNLMRASLHFLQKEYIYGAYVYEEGQQPDYIHIIVQGEVTVEITLKQKKLPQVNGIEKLKRHYQTDPPISQLSILSEGNVFGLEEVLYNIPRRNSTKCSSQRLITYALSYEHYNQHLRQDKTLVKDLEINSRIKCEFYRNQVGRVAQGKQKLLNNLITKTEQIRTMIQNESDLESLFNKLTPREIKKLAKKLDLNSLDAQLLKEQESKQSFNYSLQDFQNKKRLMSFFVQTMRVSKQQQDDDKSIYFEYRDRMSSNPAELKARTNKMLCIKNPFFRMPNSHLQMKQDRSAQLSQSYDNKIKSIKRQVIKDSNIDYNILQIPKLYETSKPKPRNNLGLNQDEEEIKEEDSYNENQQLNDLLSTRKYQPTMSSEISLSLRSYSNDSKKRQLKKNHIQNDGSSKVLISSKHNLFRLKPDRDYLIDSHYSASPRRPTAISANETQISIKPINFQ